MHDKSPFEESERPPFEDMNEEDVRHIVVENLLRELGYKTGSENNVRRNVPLQYSRRFVGRKKLHKDPELPRGYVDFILTAGGRVCWVLEAKAPSIEIGEEEIDQAWSYAIHQNVRAAFFAVCNGRTLKVFQVGNSADYPPLLSLTYSELKSKFQLLLNVLSPEAVIRAVPLIPLDPKPPIAPGLWSVARITGGTVSHKENNFGSEDLSAYQWWVDAGDVQRNENGSLVALLKTKVHDQRFQRIVEDYGLAQFEMTSEDESLSTDPSQPTVFSYEKQLRFEAGKELFDLRTNSPGILPFAIEVETKATATGSLAGQRFSGSFETRVHVPIMGQTYTMSGSFEIYLD